MGNKFFEEPILNNPYSYPARHWELDEKGQPTHEIIETRRRAEFVTPVPAPRRRRGTEGQQEVEFADETGVGTDTQKYDQISIVNQVRQHVDEWRKLNNSTDWQVTPETARLLQHWRHHQFAGIRPFFCQVEAAETAIWLTEVAPKFGKVGKSFLNHLDGANEGANPGLNRLALKLATGAGKTTVMAMLIAWQTINAIRYPDSKKFTKGFLIVAPGLTIRDRLRVLQANDPDNYYRASDLVPVEMLNDLQKAKIVITNYHAFKTRERLELSAGGRRLLQGKGEPLSTEESAGQMIQRVMPELMSIKNIIVINDEAHHCYREKPSDSEEGELKGEDKDEAKKNSEAARLWISGLEMVQEHRGISRVIDLSATPFFLQGSGYAEGTLFPWVMCDFSLIDALECGIVKLPRVPVSDNLIDREEMPRFRELWKSIGPSMPKKGRAAGNALDPLSLPVELQTALDALYGHYKKTYDLWQESGISVPPCFIVVCNNTSSSKLVYDLISGFHKTKEDGSTEYIPGKLDLFCNFDEHGNPLAQPRTLLIDSEQLESGDALDEKFREAASDEIERFRKEIVERTGDISQGEKISDQDLLREVMNTVGKEGRLGGSIRCVVSVSMLTEGWDANTVTHVLGVRAFGTQLLCEQVIGRALRRQSYDLNEDGLFNVEYADVLGIPFDFTAEPVVPKPKPPRETIHVKAMSPERDHLEIQFPRVEGYRAELPEERLEADFNEDSVLELTPDLVGPSETKNAGIIGEGVDLTIQHLGDVRPSTLVFKLTTRLLTTKWRDTGGDVEFYLFPQLKAITSKWIKECLVCRGNTYPAQLMYQELADMACERITQAITRTLAGESPIKAILDPFNPTGSSQHVNLYSSKPLRWETSSELCHINWCILDSEWEGEFCRVVEGHPKVISYVKNHGLNFEVPYQYGSTNKKYRPDFIVHVDDGVEDPLNLIVEIKGYRGEDAKDKKSTMDTYWIPGVNNLGTYGRWAFAEFRDAYAIEEEFGKLIENAIKENIEVRDGKEN